MAIAAATCAAAMATIALIPSPARAQSPFQMFGGISRPAPGVVCDRAAMTCFNGSGPSLDLTRRHLGNSAAQRLSASLSGRPPAREFRLSNGVVCSVGESTCWTSSSRNRVDQELTRDLFASAGNDGREVSKSRGLCSLNQRGRAVYDGSCELRTVTSEAGRVRRYTVSTSDERRYVFRRRGNQLELEDATGSYRVDFRDHGYTGLFRWSDMVLVVTREHRGLPMTRSGSGDQGDRIDQLFSGGSN